MNVLKGVMHKIGSWQEYCGDFYPINKFKKSFNHEQVFVHP